MRLVAIALEDITGKDLFDGFGSGEVWYPRGARGEVLSYSIDADRLLVDLRPPGASNIHPQAYRIPKSKFRLEVQDG